MTPRQPDVAGAVLALDQAMIALAVAKSVLLGETGRPVDLAAAEASPANPYGSGQCDADWGSATPSQRCVLVSDHPLPHSDRVGHQWPAMTMGEMRAELDRSTKHGRFDAASAAEVAEGVPGPCRRRNPHTPHGSCQGLAPEFPWEPTEVVAPDPFPHLPHLPQHVHGSPVCILCGIDHDAAARIAPPPHALPAIEIPSGGAL